MAAGALTFTNATRSRILDGTLASGDTYKLALLLSTSNIGSGTTTFAGVTNEHANANGYTSGGISVGPLTLSGTTTVTIDLTTDPVWTASGGNIVARFGCLYEVGGNVFGYFLLDSTPADVTVVPPNTLTIATPSGIATLA